MVHKTTSKCYDKFCADHQAELPLFYNGWYLDASCGKENWGASIYKDNNGSTQAIWPYYLKNKYGLNYITMPMLTPYMGPWLAKSLIVKQHKNYQYQHQILKKLSDQIPDVAFSTIHTSPDVQNLLSLQWAGYQEIKRYTYRLSLSNKDLWENLDAKQRNIIRKAESTLSILPSDNIDRFYSYNQKSFERQGKQIPYTIDKLRSIDQALSQHNNRTILEARDASSGRTHGMIYLAHDQQTVYLMAIGSDADLRAEGSIPLLIWQAISQFAESHKVFDFEGSMIPSIERFFRSFGGTLTPYSRLFQTKHIGIDTILKLSGRYG